MALTAGSIAFVGFNGDGSDNIAFVALEAIAAGTVINFTDKEWTGSSFSSGEGSWTWTAANAVTAGTIVRIDNVGNSPTTNTGSVSGSSGLSNDSEIVYAYVGSATSPTFLAAIGNDGPTIEGATLSGTGLTAGVNAIFFTGGLDIVAYNGSRGGQTSFANYLASINNTANWISQNTSSDDSGGTAPNAPFPTTGFTVAAPSGQTLGFASGALSLTEGDSGSKTFTFTVQRTGGTVGNVSFSGTFAAGSANAADFGGALPAPTFSGTIAAGQSSAEITITIAGDTLSETNESFTLKLTSATNASAPVSLGAASASGTIVNDDGTLIGSDSNSPQTLANNDRLTIAAGATLSASAPVTWNGGSTAPGAVLDNFGTISGGNRAVYTTESAVSGSLTIRNEAGATISATKDTVKIANLTSGTSGVITIVNEGMIKSTGTGDAAGQALDLDTVASPGVHTVITNTASGTIQAADADAIRPGTNATIHNAGIITGGGANDGIDFQDVNTGGEVDNLAGGTITGGRHGITAKQAILVDNSGTITGQLGSGINVDTAANVTATIVNSGLIVGHAAGATDGDGVDVDGLIDLDNSGTIQALGTSSASLSEALAIGGGSVHNEVGGLIVSDQRAITVDDSNLGSAFAAVSIVNEGTIQGGNGEAIHIAGTWADNIRNSTAGQIIGGVRMGGGNDTLDNDGTMTATGGSAVDLGAGEDLFVNRGTVNGDVLAGAGNDEIINVSTGHILGDIVMGDGNDKLGETGHVAGDIDMGSGDDVVNLWIGATLDGAIQLGTGDDRLTADTYLGIAINVAGGDGNDQITTALGNDVVDGGSGDDLIYTYEGDDTVAGGTGADTVFSGRGNDTIVAGAGDTVDAGADADMIELATETGGPVSVGGGDGVDTLNLRGAGAAMVGAVTNVETLNVIGGDWTLADDGFTTVAFGGGAQTLRFATASTADGDVDGTVTGFGLGDRIDLQGIGLATAATLGAGNVLTLTGGANGPVTLQLDPATDYSDLVFRVTSDGAGGTSLTATPPDFLTLRVSGDAYEGDAQFIVLVDGQQVGGVQTATASHAGGEQQDITVYGDFADAPQSVQVQFVNDAWGGSAATDRNLWVDYMSLNGQVFEAENAVNTSGGNTATEAVLPVNQGSLTFDTRQALTVRVSADQAGTDDAKFIVLVDGQQVGGVYRTDASHSTGEWDTVAIQGNFDIDDLSSVAIQFVNDYFGGSAQTDRNLWVDSITYDGQVFEAENAVNTSGGNTATGAVLPVNNGTLVFDTREALAVRVSSDLGPAEFTVTVDGQQIGGVYRTDASHSAGEWDTVAIQGDFAADPSAISIQFVNDSYGGSAETDRNLWIDSITFGGKVYEAEDALNTSGTTTETDAVLAVSSSILTFPETLLV